MMTTYTEAETKAMGPKDFRAIVRKGEYTGDTQDVCDSYNQANLVILPQKYAFEFLLFCNRNSLPCPVLDVTEPGDFHPRLMAPDADLRTDLPKYRVFKNGEIIDEPTDVIRYWQDDMVGFLLGCSRGFEWALRAAGVHYRRYGAYLTAIRCVPAGRFRGPMWVTVRGFYNAHDAVRAVQISSRHRINHGPPIHIGDPADIGINLLGKPHRFNPYRPVPDPPKPGEIVMCWGCGVTPQGVAMESKIPVMITHYPAHMFVTDRRVEEMAIL